MKIELSVKTSYLSNWGITEGVRELIQNAKDADYDGYTMNVFSPRNGILRIENKHVNLSHKSLLFGYTTKEDRDDQIGKFGEGLKLGVLALVRAGRSVKIYTGEEIWTPVIQRSKVFEEDVLCFNISKSSCFRDYIRIDIGLDSEEWDEQKNNFLFICEPNNIYKSYEGTLILDPEYSGKIFVKGIFVQHEPEFRYGYDLNNVKIDRDRCMVRNFDLQYDIMRLWNSVVAKNLDLSDLYYDMIVENTQDIRSLEYYSINNKEILARFIERWKEINGDCFPVIDFSDMQGLDFLGVPAVMVSSKPLASVLWEVFGTPENMKKRSASSVIENYKLSDLSKNERINYIRASNIVSNATKINLKDIISIVKFNSDSTLGQFDNGKILISRSSLSSCSSAISTLVHEIAHFCGNDGQKSHIDMVESIWEKTTKWFLKEK